MIVALTCSFHVVLLRNVSPVEQVSCLILMLWLILAVNRRNEHLGLPVIETP